MSVNAGEAQLAIHDAMAQPNISVTIWAISSA